MPAPARIRLSGSNSASDIASPTSTTTASSPVSGTSRFVPLPMSSVGACSSCRMCSRAAASLAEAGQAMSRAGPPILKEQCALMGSFSSSVSRGSSERMRPMSFSLTCKAQYLPPLSIIMSCSCASATAAL